MGNILQRVLQAMGLKRVQRYYQVDLKMAEIIETLALEEARNPEQVAVEMLAEGITKRARMEESFEFWDQLTPREQEVVALVCLGYMNKEIGEKLTISASTVKSHVSNVLRKYGLETRGEIQRLLMDWDFRDWDG